MAPASGVVAPHFPTSIPKEVTKATKSSCINMGEIPRVPRVLQSAVMNNTVDRKILVSWDSDVHIFNEIFFFLISLQIELKNWV